MKKFLVIALCATIVATFTACGDSSSESAAESEEAVVEEEVAAEQEEIDSDKLSIDVAGEEASAEEALDEVLDEPEEDISTTDEADADYITTTFKEMTFSYPSDCAYDEEDTYAMITLEESKEYIQIVAMGEYEQEEDDTLSMDAVLDYMIMSYLTNYDDISNESIQEVSVGGYDGQGITAIVTHNSNMISFSGVAVYTDTHNIYMIIYNYSYGAEGRLSDYEAFLDSITFGEETAEESDNSADVIEDDSLLGEKVTGGKTFTFDPLEIKAVPTEDGLVAVFITNDGDDIVQELKVQINYKDESGNTIDLDSDIHDVILPGSTVVSRMKAPDSYTDYDVEADIDMDAHPSYVNHAAYVDIQSNLGDDCIIIEITNNSDIEIREIEYDVVLYKDDNIVTILFPNDVYDVEPGQTVTEKENLYGKEFDDYEIYLNQAHTFF